MPPTIVSNVILSANYNHISISWSASFDETSIKDYTIYRGKIPGIYESTNYVGNVTSYADMAMDWAQDYYYAVTATDNSSNESWYSIESKIVLTDTLVIYDGETPETTVKNIFGPNANMTFIDVTNSPRSGAQCGQFDQINPVVLADLIGSLPFLADSIDSTPPDVMNISSMNILSLWLKGVVGNENIAVYPYFFPGITYGNVFFITNIPNTWTPYTMTLYSITNGTGVNTSNFFGFQLYPYEPPASGVPPETVYIDDVVFFRTRMQITNLYVSPANISNNKPVLVTFKATVKALTNLCYISNVYADLRPIGGNIKSALPNISGNTLFQESYNSTTNIPGGNRNIFITAEDSFGNTRTKYIIVNIADTTPPKPVTNLTLVSRFKSIVLEWSGASDETGILRYDIYRGLTPGSLVPVKTVPNVSVYTDKGLIVGTTYYYAIRTIDTRTNKSILSYTTNVIPHNIMITNILVTPSVVTNETANIIKISLFAKTSMGSIDSVFVDLTSIGGASNTIMTQQFNQFYTPFLLPQYTYNGIKEFPIHISDNTGMVSNAYAYLDVRSITLLKNGHAEPAIIFNNQRTNVIFVAAVASSWAPIQSVIIDLSPVGGPSDAVMQNFSGATGYQYTGYTNPLHIKGGTNLCYVTITDMSNNIGIWPIPLIVIDNTRPTQPENFKLIRATKEYIHLSWEKSYDETKLWGYNLYRSVERNKEALTNYLFFINNKTTSYEDREALINTENVYRLKAVDTSGNESLPAGPIEVKIVDLDGTVQAWQNYVRTCMDEKYTDIYVEVENDNSRIEVNIYDLSGEKVRTIVSSAEYPSEFYNRGIYHFIWNLHNDYNQEAETGVYIVLVKVGNKVSHKKIFLIRCD